jgi:WD40 repeat protein
VLATVSADATARLWNYDSLKCEIVHRFTGDEPLSIAIHSSGRRIFLACMTGGSFVLLIFLVFFLFSSLYSFLCSILSLLSPLFFIVCSLLLPNLNL